MVGGRRKTAPSESKAADERKSVVKGYQNSEGSVVVLDGSSSQSQVATLRGRWELASVLNFLSVFDSVIGRDVKLTAEEVETGLIKPNDSIARLHITLLKGIPPVSKMLNDSGGWVTVLRKKLAVWWPWVAEGEIPLTTANGEEVSRYKELDPTSRLLILKALCEIRADQHDAVSYINDGLKQGTQVSSFRKENIGENGNGTSYWYDGNTVTGYRLYREVKKTKSMTKSKRNLASTQPAVYFQWETLATNLEEFTRVVDELSSSKQMTDVSIGETIETELIPVIKKFHMKKERALKRKERQEMLLNYSRSSFNAGITGLRRSRRIINYTFADYDRTIDEAIQLMRDGTTVEGQKQEKRIKQEQNDSSGRKVDNMDIITETEKLQETGNDDVENDEDYDDSKDDSETDSGSCGDQKDNPDNKNHVSFPAEKKHRGSRWSKRLAGIASSPAAENDNLSSKKSSRQSPVPVDNSVLDTTIMPDSDDEILSEYQSSGISGAENSSPESRC